jgi:hypothetical protein
MFERYKGSEGMGNLEFFMLSPQTLLSFCALNMRVTKNKFSPVRN